MLGFSLPDTPTRIVIASAFAFWALTIVYMPVVYPLPEAYLGVALAAFLPLWIAVIALWLRRTRGGSDNIWGAVSESQATGRYSNSGGISVAEQRDALSDSSEEDK